MPLLKFQFHVHTGQDPCDRPWHTEKEMIDTAARHQYDVVAITCHNKVIFDEDLKNYAAAQKILLLPGIEKDVEKRHVLIINATPEAEKIQNFTDLQTYKKSHPDCYIIAPHPYYFTSFCLREKFEPNIDLFDAVEYSWYHTRTLNSWNKKAEKIAAKHGLPMIATSDNHILKYFDRGFSEVEAEEKTWESIRKSLKANKIKLTKRPFNIFGFLLATLEMTIGFELRNKFHRSRRKLGI